MSPIPNTSEREQQEWARSETVVLMHDRYPLHLRKGTARMKQEKESVEG